MKDQEPVVNENGEAYISRIENAIENIESGNNIVSISPSDFEKLSNELLAGE